MKEKEAARRGRGGRQLNLRLKMEKGKRVHVRKRREISDEVCVRVKIRKNNEMREGQGNKKGESSCMRKGKLVKLLSG